MGETYGSEIIVAKKKSDPIGLSYIMTDFSVAVSKLFEEEI